MAKSKLQNLRNKRVSQRTKLLAAKTQTSRMNGFAKLSATVAELEQAERSELGCHALETHHKAWTGVSVHERGFAVSIHDMIGALERYAQAHLAKFGEPVARDGYSGDEFRDMVESVRRLLSAPTGGLDGGTVDSKLNDLLAFAGFDPEGEK